MRVALDAQVLIDSRQTAGAVFRHALMQEAVYDSLLPSERRRHHLGFVRALEAPRRGVRGSRRGSPRSSITRSPQTISRRPSGPRSAPARRRRPRARSWTRPDTSIERCSCSTSCPAHRTSWMAAEAACSGSRRKPPGTPAIPLDRSGCGRRPSPPCRRMRSPADARDPPPRPRGRRERDIRERPRAGIDPGGERAARRRAAIAAASPRARRPRSRPVHPEPAGRSAAANEQAIEMAVELGDRRVEATRARPPRAGSLPAGRPWRTMRSDGDRAACHRARDARSRRRQLRVHECRLGARSAGEAGRAADLIVDRRRSRSRASSGCRPSRWRRGEPSICGWRGAGPKGAACSTRRRTTIASAAAAVTACSIAEALYDATMGRFDPAAGGPRPVRLDDRERSGSLRDRGRALPVARRSGRGDRGGDRRARARTADDRARRPDLPRLGPAADRSRRGRSGRWAGASTR